MNPTPEQLEAGRARAAAADARVEAAELELEAAKQQQGLTHAFVKWAERKLAG